MIAIEILSPEDRTPRVILRLEGFVAMGVVPIWLIDPFERVAYTFDGDLHLVEEAEVRISGSPVCLDLDWLFASPTKRSVVEN